MRGIDQGSSETGENKPKKKRGKKGKLHCWRHLGKMDKKLGEY